jgi:gliding motility-associated-like protein
MKKALRSCFSVFPFLLSSLLILLSQNIFPQQNNILDSAYMKSRQYVDISKLPSYEKNRIFLKLKKSLNMDISYSKENGFSNNLAKIYFSYFKENINILSVKRTFTKLRNTDLASVYTVCFKDSNQLEEIISKLKQISLVDYAEKIPLYYSFYTPNDFNIYNQTYLSKINAVGAWDITHGSADVRIAIVDDAVLTTHNDLMNKIWVNPNETAGNGIDDDGNGYIDDVKGYDVSDSDNVADPPANANINDFTHGTHVAGIAAAETDNGNGIASVGFNCSIIPVKCKPDTAFGPALPDAFLGLEYAISINPDIINMSWGGFINSATYNLLCTTAHNQGIVLVAAAGNTGTEIDLYPASYDYVISVGSTNLNDIVSMLSSYGSKIDVMAPSVNILSTLAGGNNNYGQMSGTSMAAPIVSGICALMKSNNPGMTPDDIELCLKASCNNINQKNPSKIAKIGSGRVNALGAVTCVEAPPGPVVCNGSEGVFVCTGTSFQFHATSSGLNATSWEWQFPGGTPSTSTLQDPVITYNIPGVYDVVLVGCNNYGCDTLVLNNYVYVGNPFAVLSAVNTGIVCKASAAYIDVQFYGTPPFSFAYTDGVIIDTISNINSYDYSILVYPTTNGTYSLVWMKDAYCYGDVSGSATLNPVDCGACSNNDFEFGNFSTWVGGLGHCCGDTAYLRGIVSDRQHIVSGSGTDPFTNGTVLEISPYGGSFSAKLGNCYVGGEAEKLYKTFVVTPDNANFTYQYAVFLEDPPGHAQNMKPKFEVNIYDANGQLLPGPCSHYQVTAGPSTAGWQQNNLLRYKGWQIMAVDLSPYMGQAIKIEFKTEDCGLLGHFGYAYIDATCGPQNIMINGFCDGVSQITLTAPVGYESYQWLPYGDTTQIITIPAPQAGDTATVTMTNALGCTSTIVHVFQQYPKPVPVISHDTTICLQDTIVLTATGAGSGGTYQWTSDPPGFTSTDSIIVVNPSATTSYSVYEVNANGCPADSIPQVTINVNGHLAFNLGTDIQFCKDDSVTVIADSISGTYLWSSYPPGFISSAHQVTVMPAYPTTYILTVNDGICSFKDSIKISEYDYFYEQPISKAYYCSGNSNVTLTGPLNYSNYYWLETGDLTQSITIANPVQYTIYSLSMISPAGCMDTMRFMLEKIEDPIANAGLDTFVCKSFGTMLFATGTNTDNGTYSWTSIPAGYSASGSSVFVAPQITTFYIVEVTNGPDCDSPPSYDTVVVTVKESPEFELGPDTTICFGDSISKTISIAGSFDFWTSSPSGFLSNDSTVILKPVETTTYYLTVNSAECSFSDYFTIEINKGTTLPDTSNKYYCASDTIVELIAPNGYAGYYWPQTGDSTQIISIGDPVSESIFTVLGINSNTGCEDTILVKITGTKPINLDVTASDTNICNGEMVFLYATVITNTSYNWSSVPSGFSSNNTNPYLVPVDTTLFICEADSNGCKATDSIKIIVTNYPFFHLGNDTIVCFGEKVFIDPQVSAQHLTWSNGSSDTAIVVDSTGIYTLMASNGTCIIDDTIVVTVLDADVPFVVPNVFTPNGDGYNDYLDVQQNNTEQYHLELYNRWGEKIFETSDPSVKWDGTRNSDAVPDGVYFYIANYKSSCNEKIIEINGTVTVMR